MLTVWAIETKKFQTLHDQVSMMVIDLKFRSPITGSIKPCEYFPVACTRNFTNIFKLGVFFNMHAYVNNVGSVEMVNIVHYN